MIERRQYLEWRGNSLTIWRGFPAEAQREGGFQLDLMQKGVEPTHWRPMRGIGTGVIELRIWDDAKRTYRIICTARFANRIVVLHVFEKKSQKTPQREIEIARQRYKDLERAFR
jgi:phage-related protein